jgi:epoxyqueuosine reductase
MGNQELHNYILKISSEMGFVAYGAVKSQKLIRERENLEAYLRDSYNGTMGYLARNIDLREDPSLLVEGTKSILVFLVPYKPSAVTAEDLPQISSYAYGLDYHRFVRERLKALAERIKEHRPGMEYRVFTDSAPVFERSLATLAGLGFIGKNTFLINKKAGLHTLIGTIFTNEEVLYNDSVVKEGCGRCTRCIDACPSGALTSPYRLDSRRCISYHTIESKYEDYKNSFSCDGHRYIFGCEICLNACPWSSRGDTTSWGEFAPLSDPSGRGTSSYTAEEWLEMDEEFFKSVFSKSPLSRAGLAKMKHNVQNILNNEKDEMAHRG